MASGLPQSRGSELRAECRGICPVVSGSNSTVATAGKHYEKFEFINQTAIDENALSRRHITCSGGIRVNRLGGQSSWICWFRYSSIPMILMVSSWVSSQSTCSSSERIISCMMPRVAKSCTCSQ